MRSSRQGSSEAQLEKQAEAPALKLLLSGKRRCALSPVGVRLQRFASSGHKRR